MKKTLLFAAAALVLAACTKETPAPVKEEGAIDASKLVFNIDVQNGDATKGVKTAWENGDDVYLFFEDNTTQYVKMTYDGTDWTYADKDGGTTFTGLTLAASGKKVCAVYFPDFVLGTTSFFHDGSAWTIDGAWNGYFQRTDGVEYSVTTTSDVTTLNATLTLTAPNNLAQIFIPDSEAPAPASGNEYVLTATHFIQCSFGYAYAGGDVVWSNGGNGHPLTAYHGTLGGETGYYFWGLLDSGADTYDFDFQLVERNAEKEYAISSKSKSVTGKTVPGSFAAKLTGLMDNGSFVDLGFGDCLWATGNLDKTNGRIADPLDAGDYYKWGYTSSYDKAGTTDAHDNYKDPYDFEDTATAKNAEWIMPTKEQFEALCNSENTNATTYSQSWKTGWTSLGSTNGGMLLTSEKNGISLFLAAAGFYSDGSLSNAGDYGYFWSSTHYYSERAYSLRFFNGYIETDHIDCFVGLPVRPVKNK